MSQSSVLEGKPGFSFWTQGAGRPGLQSSVSLSSCVVVVFAATVSAMVVAPAAAVGVIGMDDPECFNRRHVKLTARGLYTSFIWPVSAFEFDMLAVMGPEDSHWQYGIDVEVLVEVARFRNPGKASVTFLLIIFTLGDGLAQ